MASYNNARFAKESIKSVLAQSYTNWELIIVDDASSDNSVKVILEYLVDPRIKLFINKENLGVGATKKRCAEEASGDVFAVLDIDDTLDENSLALMNRAYRENPTVDFIYSDTYECDENLKIKGILPWIGKLKEQETNLHIFKVCQLRTFKKKLYEKTSGYDSNLRSAVDRDIIYKLEEVGVLKYIKIPLYYYRIHDSGISKTSDSKLKNVGRLSCVIVAKSAYQRRLKNKFLNLSRKEMSIQSLDGLSPALKLGEYYLFFRLLIYSVFLYPFNCKRYYLFIVNLFKK
jgi:glycosyltransferase involved in cell wall biosynthesis